MQSFIAHVANAIETALLFDALKKARNPIAPKNELQRKIEIGQFHLRNIVTLSLQIPAIVRLIDQIHDSLVDVSIRGKSGIGKELVTNTLHFNSPLYNQPFIALNCASLHDNLVEAELYGIEKGVATSGDHRTGKFEAANGGTLLLDEIGDLSLSVQARTLRALQEREIDRVGGQKPIALNVRVIAATSKNLECSINDHSFCEESLLRAQSPAHPDPAAARDRPRHPAHGQALSCQTQWRARWRAQTDLPGGGEASANLSLAGQRVAIGK